MRKFFKSLQRDERGVSALEYAILAGAIALAVVVAVGGFGDGLTTLFQDLGTVPTAPTGG